MKIEKIICDVKNCITKKEDVQVIFKNIDIQVIFETDQTDGITSKPYLENIKLDLCENCKNKILNGNYLYAYGAQGYNTYYFK